MKTLFLSLALVLSVYTLNGTAQNTVKRTKTETIVQTCGKQHLIKSEEMKSCYKQSFTHAFVVPKEASLKYIMRLADILNNTAPEYNRKNTLIICQGGDNQWIKEAAEGYATFAIQVISKLGNRIVECDLGPASSNETYHFELIKKRDILKE